MSDDRTLDQAVKTALAKNAAMKKAGHLAIAQELARSASLLLERANKFQEAGGSRIRFLVAQQEAPPALRVVPAGGEDQGLNDGTKKG